MRESKWDPRVRVIACGVRDGAVTEDGSGEQEFENFEAAREVFPQLSLDGHSTDFCGPMEGGRMYRERVLRFETPKAYEMFST
jgi:hypothetical protein